MILASTNPSQLYRLQENSVLLSPHAGGFPGNAQGGLVGEIALECVRLGMGVSELPLPYTIAVRLSRPLAPGGTFRVELEQKGPAMGVTFYDGEDPRVTAEWQQIESQPPSPFPNLEADIENASGTFRCIPSCVTMGEANPEGLHLQAKYHRDPSSQRATRFWAEIPPQEAQRRMRELMAMDELAWWCGASHGFGITGRYEYTRWGEGGLLVFGRVPEKKKSAMKIPVVSVDGDGRVTAEMVNLHMVNPAAATVAMRDLSEADSEKFKNLLRQFQGE